MRMSDADKLKIVDAIRKKCQKHGHKDFSFSQAYYCANSGKIKKHRMSLLANPQ